MIVGTSSLQRSGCGNRLHIKEKQGDEIGASHSYHQLGMVAYTRQDLDAAEQWYFKSLEINEKLNDEIGLAETYCNLSDVAEDARE